VRHAVYLPEKTIESSDVGASVGRIHRYAFRIHQDETTREELMLDLEEIARAGARKMLAQALEAEVEAYLDAASQGERDENGHALVVRNGRAREREVLLGAGAVEVRAPRVNDKRVDEDGQRRRFKSVILPPYMRRSPKVTEVLPLLYLHGLCSADFIPALEGFFGTEAGLSASTVRRLTEQWQIERERFMSRDLSKRDYVYVWVDGIHTGVRLGSEERLCSLLVMIGARLDGTKELVAITQTATGNLPRAGRSF
jgi:putative transposase